MRPWVAEHSANKSSVTRDHIEGAGIYTVMLSPRALRLGITLTVLLAACDDADAGDRSSVCFPVPGTDTLRSAGPPTLRSVQR